MKLKEGFVVHNVAGDQYLVTAGNVDFRGIVRSNPTAAYIIDHLKEDTSIERIVDDMCEKYNADKETIETDVESIIESLRGIGAIEE